MALFGSYAWHSPDTPLFLANHSSLDAAIAKARGHNGRHDVPTEVRNMMTQQVVWTSGAIRSGLGMPAVSGAGGLLRLGMKPRL